MRAPEASASAEAHLVATTFRLRDGCEYSKKWGWAHGGYWAVCANLGGNGAFWAGRKGGEFGEKEQAFWRQEDLAAGRRARTSRGLEGVEGFAGGEGKQGKRNPKGSGVGWPAATPENRERRTENRTPLTGRRTRPPNQASKLPFPRPAGGQPAPNRLQSAVPHSGSPACGSTPLICLNLRNLRFPGGVRAAGWDQWDVPVSREGAGGRRGSSPPDRPRPLRLRGKGGATRGH